MQITQISIFLENTQGRLAEVCDTLGRASVNIRALTIAESPEFGVLRVVVDRPAEALAALKTAGFVASQTRVVAVQVEDRPGGLAQVLAAVADAKINVEYMYGFVEKHSAQALLVFRFDDPDRAAAALRAAGVVIIDTLEGAAL